MGGWLGGWLENWRIKLSQPSTKVEVEVEAELGKKGQIECFIFFLEKGPIVIFNSDIFEKFRPRPRFWKIPN